MNVVRTVIIFIKVYDFIVDKCFWGIRRKLCHIKFSEYISPDKRYSLQVLARDYTYREGRIILTDLISEKTLEAQDISNVNRLTKVDWEAVGVNLTIKDDDLLQARTVNWRFYL